MWYQGLARLVLLESKQVLSRFKANQLCREMATRSKSVSCSHRGRWGLNLEFYAVHKGGFRYVITEQKLT